MTYNGPYAIKPNQTKTLLIAKKFETGIQYRSSDMTLRDKPSSGCSSDALKELMECNPRKSTQELALDLSNSQSPIFRHLKKK